MTFGVPLDCITVQWTDDGAIVAEVRIKPVSIETGFDGDACAFCLKPLGDKNNEVRKLS